jgi:hypothetical protein
LLTVFRRSARAPEPCSSLEVTAKEIGRISLAEALDVTLLIARKDPGRHHPSAARACRRRWLRRYLEESDAT